MTLDTETNRKHTYIGYVVWHNYCLQVNNYKHGGDENFEVISDKINIISTKK